LKIIDFSELKMYENENFENEIARKTESRRELGIFFETKLRSK